MSFVVDNSVALAWCFEDEQSPAVMNLLDRVTEAGAVAPQLWPIEALNGLLTAERRGRINAERRRQLAGFLYGLGIDYADAGPYLVTEVGKSITAYSPTDDGHPLESGYGAYARAVYDIIITDRVSENRRVRVK